MSVNSSLLILSFTRIVVFIHVAVNAQTFAVYVTCNRYILPYSTAYTRIYLESKGIAIVTCEQDTERIYQIGYGRRINKPS